jgi:GNAT superfamily N-acetyltransferase
MAGEGQAKLRLLYVEASCRGRGVGRMLVRACVAYARQAGYPVITLWTNSILTSARRIYESEGFQLVRDEAHHSFGTDLIGQTFELQL